MEKEREHDLGSPERKNDIYTRPSVIRKVETRRKVDVTQFSSSSGITFQKGLNDSEVLEPFLRNDSQEKEGSYLSMSPCNKTSSPKGAGVQEFTTGSKELMAVGYSHGARNQFSRRNNPLQRPYLPAVFNPSYLVLPDPEVTNYERKPQKKIQYSSAQQRQSIPNLDFAKDHHQNLATIKGIKTMDIAEECDDRIGSSKLEQGESENRGFISWSYGLRSSKQAYFGTSNPAQYENGFEQEDELRREHVSCLCRQRLIKQTCRLGELEQERGHKSSAFKIEEEPTRLSCFGRRQTIQQTPSESQQVVALKQKYECTRADLPSSFQGGTTPRQSCLGKLQQREDESAPFLQEHEDKIAHCPLLFRIESISHARLHKPYHTEDKNVTFKEEGEDKIARHLMWLGANRMVKQTSYDKDHPGDFERTEPKEEDQGLMSPVKQCTSPSQYEVKTVDRVSRQLQINHNLHPWKLHSKLHEEDVFGCPNESKKIRGTTCPVCHKKLKRFHYLKTHLLIHEGTKPYSCAYCSKTFNQIGNRNAHQRMHTGEKPYACDYCDKRFVFSSSKHNHMKTHRQRELADDQTTGICKDNI